MTTATLTLTLTLTLTPNHRYMATFVDVRDVAAAIAAALVTPAAAGERFLLVSDEPPMNTVELGAVAQVTLRL